MENLLLDLVLSRAVQLEDILSWSTHEDEGAELPCAAWATLESQTTAAKTSLPLTPATFRATILNCVREEAIALVACLETGSEAATPRASDLGLSPAQTPGASKSVFRQPVKGTSLPATLDEANFPSLGASQPNKGKHAKLPAGALMRLVNPSTPLVPQQTTTADSAGSRNSAPIQYRIAPTAVQSVERDARFLVAPAGQPVAKQDQGKPRKIAPCRIEGKASTHPAFVEKQQDTPGANLGSHGRGAVTKSSWAGNSVSEPAGTAFRDILLGRSTPAVSQKNASGANSAAKQSAENPNASSTLLSAEMQTAPLGWENRLSTALGQLPAARGSTELQGSPTASAAWTRRQPSRSPEGTLERWEKRLTGSAGVKASPASSRGSSSPTPASADKPRSPRKTQQHKGMHSRGTPANKPPRAESPVLKQLCSGSPEPRNPSRAWQDSPSPTPQSRFRPAPAGVCSPDPSSSSFRVPSANQSTSLVQRLGDKDTHERQQSSADGDSATPLLAPEADHALTRKPAIQDSDTADSIGISFNGLQMGPPRGTASPQTPMLGQAKRAWVQPEGVSPQGSAYFTASETESSSSADNLIGGERYFDAASPSGDCSFKALPLEGDSMCREASECQVSAATESATKLSSKKEVAARLEQLAVQPARKDVPAEVTSKSRDESINVTTAAHKPGSHKTFTARQMGSAAEVLAALHAHLLANCTSVHLCMELDLLLQLLTLPEGLTRLPSGDTPRQPLLWCSEAAAAYACTVLQASGGLIMGLGVQMLEAMHESPAVQSSAQLAEAVSNALSNARAQAPRESRLQETGADSTGALTLLAFTSDGLTKRTPEEQRRVSNREMCRDELLALLRQSSALGQSFSNAKQVAVSQAGAEEAAFALIQHRVPLLLRKISPDNFAHMAELFAAAVLQAAATGEVVLDEELSKLAKQDVTRFQRLNQRFQAPESQPGRLQVSPASSGPSIAGAGQQPVAAIRGRLPASKAAAGKASQEGTQSALLIAAEFPPALRLYVLFLEAADSYRLNSNLIRCMAQKLRQLCSDGGGHKGPASSQQQMSAVSALAGLLSYLSFAAGSSQQPQSTWNMPPPGQASPPVDIQAALQQAADPSTLLQTVQWVARFLWFLPWDPGASGSPYYASVLATLDALHHCSPLQPGGSSFRSAQLCMRSVLDSLAERLGGLDSGHGSLAAADLQICNAASGGEVDVRLMQMCCPILEQSRWMLLAHAAGSKRQSRLSRLRKITPSVPTTSGVRASIPLAVQAAAVRHVDPDMLMLQRAFLDMYSTAEQKVTLRDVVAYVSEVVGHSVTAVCLDSCILPLVTSAAQQLDDQASAVCQRRSPAPSSDILQALLLPLTEQLIADTTSQALSSCLERAEDLVKRRVTSALPPLSHPSWTNAIVETAAAIAADSAKSLSANQFIAEVPSKVRTLLTIKATEAARAAAREARQRAAATSEQT